MAKLSPDVPQEVVDVANAIAWERIDESVQRERIATLEEWLQGRIRLKTPGQAYGGSGGQRVRRAVPQWVLDILSKYDYTPFGNAFMRKAMKGAALGYLRSFNIPLIDD